MINLQNSPKDSEKLQPLSEIKISAGILAGGESLRMGQNKALIRIGNERIIDRLTAEFSSFSEVIISAAEQGIYEDTGLKTVYDENKKIGPMEGIRQVLLAASEEYVFICAADMPFLRKELVSYLAGYISSDYDCYVMADEDHIQPLCAIYSKRVLPVVEELIKEGRYRLREIFKRVSTKYITLEYTCFDRKTVRNINTRQELREITKPFVFCVSGYSDSGKTGLIVKLINEFIGNNMSVGVIKHDGHDAHTDLPGSDTDRFRKAGALCTGVYSKSGHSEYVRESVSAEELVRKMSRIKAPPDAIIIEGLKDSHYPKIEVVRKAVYDKSVCDKASLICIVSDCISPEDHECPVYGTEDIRGIFYCLKSYFEPESYKDETDKN